MGSSPLTRGKQGATVCRVARVGLIPAHAGKTDETMRSISCLRAHPRSRGENLTPAGRLVIDGGSSPLTRGKQASPRSSRKKIGLIPAHAGKTSSSGRWPHKERAHPRSRGENKAVSTLARKHVGSSPLTRGKRRVPRRLILREGLIPAHAGKTWGARRRYPPRWAHPRSRGENGSRQVRPSTFSGSSPLTRGKHCRQAQHPRKPGLIPAHAGKTY